METNGRHYFKFEHDLYELLNIIYCGYFNKYFSYTDDTVNKDAHTGLEVKEIFL